MPVKHKSKVKTTTKEGPEDDASSEMETEDMEEAGASSQISSRCLPLQIPH